MELIPQAREIIEYAREQGNEESAAAVEEVLESTLNRPEHEWFLKQKDLVEAAKDNTSEPASEEEEASESTAESDADE